METAKLFWSGRSQAVVTGSIPVCRPKIKNLRHQSGAVFSKVQRFSQNRPVLIFLRHGLSKAVIEKNGRDGGWLITGLNPVESLRTRQLNQVIHGAAEAAQIDKPVSMRTLRCYY